MIRRGQEPYLECSSAGDKRLSAFHARIKGRENKTIEEIYQAAKVLSDGRTGLDWRLAKGKRAVNQEECSVLYSRLWDEYIAENLFLLEELALATGLSDKFGVAGHCCQAIELWRIRNEFIVQMKEV